MQIKAEDLMKYHCPRWNELPEIELYIDQVVSILQNNLSVFSKDKNIPIITSSMINNYVKQQILEPPHKKKYNRTHLAYLFVICIFKRLMSISDIGDSIAQMQALYSTEEGYDIFCDELEKALRCTINPSYGNLPTVEETNIREIATLRAMVQAFSNSVLVDRLILMRNK